MYFVYMLSVFFFVGGIRLFCVVLVVLEVLEYCCLERGISLSGKYLEIVCSLVNLYN